MRRELAVTTQKATINGDGVIEYADYPCPRNMQGAIRLFKRDSKRLDATKLHQFYQEVFIIIADADVGFRLAGEYLPSYQFALGKYGYNYAYSIGAKLEVVVAADLIGHPHVCNRNQSSHIVPHELGHLLFQQYSSLFQGGRLRKLKVAWHMDLSQRKVKYAIYGRCIHRRDYLRYFAGSIHECAAEVYSLLASRRIPRAERRQPKASSVGYHYKYGCLPFHSMAKAISNVLGARVGLDFSRKAKVSVDCRRRRGVIADSRSPSERGFVRAKVEKISLTGLLY